MASTPQMLSRATALKSITKNLASPKIWCRAAGGSFLNVDINKNFIDVAVDRHEGEGTQPLDPIVLYSSSNNASQIEAQKRRQKILSQPALQQLQEVIQDNDVRSVLLTWPTRDVNQIEDPQAITEDEESYRVLTTLNSVLREPSSQNDEGMSSVAPVPSTPADCITTSRPFYMLDGGGRRMASMCLVKSSSSQNPNVHQVHSKVDYNSTQLPAGTWLKEYSLLMRDEAERAA